MATQAFAAARIPLRKPTPFVLFSTAGLGLCVAYLFVASPSAQEGIYHLLGIAPSIAIVAGVRRYRPERAGALYVLAAGSAVGALGDFFYYGYGWFGAKAPFPGPADYMYIAGDLLIVAGVGLVSLRRGRVRDLLDSAIISLAGVLVIYAVVIGPNLDHDAPVWVTVIAAGSPFLDAALLVVLMPLVLSRPRNTALRLLMLYASVVVVGDTIYGVQTLHDSYVGGGALDLTWLLGFVFLAATGFTPSLREVSAALPRRRWDDWGRVALLGASTMTVVSVLASLTPQWSDEYLGVCVGTYVTVLLVFARIALIHGEQRGSTRKLSLESNRLAMIEAIQRDLAAGLDLETFLQSACERAHALVGGGVTVSVLSGDELIVTATAGMSGLAHGQKLARKSLAAHAIEEDRVLIAVDAENDPRVDSQLVAKTGARSLIAAPLHFAGTPIGAVNFASQRVGAFAGRDARTASLIASLVSVAVNRDSEFAARRALSEIVESSSEAVVKEDLNGQILFWNHGAERLFSYSSEEVFGKNVDLIIPPAPEHRSAKTAQLERLLRGELVAPVEVERIRRDGRRVLISLSLTAIRDVNGRIVGVTGTGRDITETRELEQQLYQAQKMEAVGRLAGGIAHDFNNLLTAIEGYGSMLLDLVEGDETKRRYAKQVVEAAKRSAELTQQLLAYSRKQVLQPGIVDPNMIVDEIDQLLMRMVGEDVRVVCELDPDVGRVLVDRSRLGQIVMNLAVNARDAMPHGGCLTINTSAVQLSGLEGSATGGAPEGAYVCIAVTDTGTGMDEEVVKQIFEPFFTTKPEHEGTGLGLATVLGTVTQSGGYIGVRTAPGEGTTFSVYLPQCAEQSEELVASVA